MLYLLRDEDEVEEASNPEEPDDDGVKKDWERFPGNKVFGENYIFKGSYI